jgi:hypothetical protein
MTDLKLLALDSEDLEVISATTQDAVIRVRDMGYARGDKRFALLMNRYAWEVDGGRSKGQRRRAALSFGRVTAVAAAGVDLNALDGVLELLDIRFEPADEPAGNIELRFAGGGTVRLAVECVEARLEDLGAAWAAKAKPEHSL